MRSRRKLGLPIRVFDFFSGCGGTCVGFRRAGLEVAYALDSDEDARMTFSSYRAFQGVPTETRPIEEVEVESIRPLIEAANGAPILFSGCAPCQPFSRQNRYRNGDRRSPLLLEFLRFVLEYKPDYVFVENVAGIQDLDSTTGPLGKFVATLGEEYHHQADLVLSQDYGVPQRRRRFVLIASRHGEIEFPRPTHGPESPTKSGCRSVGATILDLPPLGAGEQDPQDPIHRAASLAPVNVERIRCCGEGEGREKWPPRLRLPCHEGHSGHSDVYGRMRWDAPASALTTRCISLSNGRFGHPEQDRAISVREAALLQTFPRRFMFHGSMASMARQIGNAVPPRLAYVFGRHFVKHFKEHHSG